VFRARRFGMRVRIPPEVPRTRGGISGRHAALRSRCSIKGRAGSTPAGCTMKQHRVVVRGQKINDDGKREAFFHYIEYMDGEDPEERRDFLRECVLREDGQEHVDQIDWDNFRTYTPS
jgi:hypothetical protein